MNRKRYIERIQDALGDRKLIWVGTRGHDAIGLMDIPQFSEAYGIIAPLGALSLDVDIALEDISLRRVDLDTYTIDTDWSPEANQFRRRLLDSLTEPAWVVSYRSLALLSAVCYPRAEFVKYLGMFHERQATFEHKPWVETELKRMNVPVIPWRYFAAEDITRLEEELRLRGEVVLRLNRSDGGAGLSVLAGTDRRLPEGGDGFFAAAPVLDPHVPLNISGCLFKNGEVTLHGVSVQLIGIAGFTRRRFGYCGNDFAAPRALERKFIDDLEHVTRTTAGWLHSHGYVGAFGVDALVYDGRVLLTEVNPRFQGSTSLAARLDRELDRPDVMTCHIAAHLGMNAPSESTMSLFDLVSEAPSYAQLIAHEYDGAATHKVEVPASMGRGALEIQAKSGIEVEPDAILYRAVFDRMLTSDGKSLDVSSAAERHLGVVRSQQAG